MIDEERTMELFGYTSDKWSPKSGKHVAAVCEECGTYRVCEKKSLSVLCRSCSRKLYMSEIHYPLDYNTYSIDYTETFKSFGYDASRLPHKSRKKVIAVCTICGKSRAVEKKSYTDLCFACASRAPERCHKLSIANSGTNNSMYGTTPHNIGKPPSISQRRKLSATRQGIPYDEWESFAKDQPYCPKFNEACREANREKYDRCCFLSGMTEDENGKKLSVHHIDMNKNQGCDGNAWRLVPLSKKWHAKSHADRWIARIQYLLEHVWNPGRNDVIS